MKKGIIVISLILLFLTSGCTVEYTLDVSDATNIVETILGETSSDSMTKEQSGLLFEYYKGLEPLLKYTSGLKTENSVSSVKFEIVYKSLESYITESPFPLEYGYSIIYTHEDDLITIDGDIDIELDPHTRFFLPTYDTIAFNIIVGDEVLEHNAEKVLNNTYSWILEKGELKKDIKIVYKGEDVGSGSNWFNSDVVIENSPFGELSFIFFGILLFFGGIGFLVYKKIEKDKN